MDSDNQNNNQPQVVQQQWQYQSGQLEQPIAPSPAVEPQAEPDRPTVLVSWSASEFVSHEKSVGWYLLLGFLAVLTSAIIFIITREIFSIIVVLVLAIALAVFGNLKPRTLDYALEDSGIQIGDKFFAYGTFKSFAIIEDSTVPSIQLLPQKRFMVPITVYFAPNDEDIIVSTLGNFLPFEHKKRDTVDKISSRIRF